MSWPPAVILLPDILWLRRSGEPQSYATLHKSRRLEDARKSGVSFSGYFKSRIQAYAIKKTHIKGNRF